MFDDKNKMNQDTSEDTDYTEDTGTLGGESEQEEDVTDESIVEDMEEEETDQAM